MCLILISNNNVEFLVTLMFKQLNELTKEISTRFECKILSSENIEISKNQNFPPQAAH
jgi:hypothetical protein